uniref:Cytochrome c oxidase subunit 3 n=1 Tax=Babesia microti TaxID=5868 RepID=K7ZN73_BABMI|nr:cytochrome oxidase subunit III [Babesia microti]BAM68218.1 cytochrome oxidase subunit III [Babesia microti]BAM68221.1 cytochrome oxidase subunit III [Babesia microti]BAM68224.1 cytochrome oxidase subunit III [Babesia microti]BAM68227.1 cytochrome oxidase subunit III [Babesia microti]
MIYFIIVYSNINTIYSSTLKELSSGMFLVNVVLSILATLQENAETLTFTVYSIVSSVILSELLLFASLIYSVLHSTVCRDPLDISQATECLESLTDSLALGGCSTTLLLFEGRDRCYSLYSKYNDVCTLSAVLYSYMQSNEYNNMLHYVNTSSLQGLFYCITVVHALHVLLGVSILMIDSINHSEYYNSMITDSYLYLYIATYWHFVEAVWLSLLTLLYMY